MARSARLVVDIFEGRGVTPVVSHTFYGKDEAEAWAVLEAHSKADEFLRAALTTRNYRGIPLRVSSRWE